MHEFPGTLSGPQDRKRGGVRAGFAIGDRGEHGHGLKCVIR